MKRGSNSRNVRVALCFGLMAMVTVGWYVWPRKVELSSDTYEIAVALYRVCNQRDEQGLHLVHQKLTELSATANPDDADIAHLQGIINEAESGDWASATKQTRMALEDQTRKL